MVHVLFNVLTHRRSTNSKLSFDWHLANLTKLLSPPSTSKDLVSIAMLIQVINYHFLPHSIVYLLPVADFLTSM